MYISGDGVQCSELMNFGGHASKNGCRFCLREGRHRVDVRNKDGKIEEGKHGMYFEKRNQDLRSKKSLSLENKGPKYVSFFVKLNSALFIVYITKLT